MEVLFRTRYVPHIDRWFSLGKEAWIGFALGRVQHHVDPERDESFERHDHEAFVPAAAYLYVPKLNDSVRRLRGQMLSGQSIVVDQTADCDWRLTSVVARDWKWFIETYELQIGSDNLANSRLTMKDRLQIADSARKIGDAVRFVTHFDKHLAIAYECGRIEIRRLDNPGDVCAVGYTSSRPSGIVVSQRSEGKFLVVAAGDLNWFEITRYAI